MNRPPRDRSTPAWLSLRHAPGVMLLLGVTSALWFFVGRGGGLDARQALVVSEATLEGFAVHQLFHTHGVHLAVNLLVILVAGGILERHWGTFTFSLFVLFVGLGVAATDLVAGRVMISSTILQGAKPACFGGSGLALACLVSMAVAFPRGHLLRGFSVRSLVWTGVFLGAAGLGFLDFQSATATATATATDPDASRLLLMPQISGVGLGLIFLWVLPRVHAYSASIRTERERRRREDVKLIRFKVDELLEKISVSGYASLSDEEKRFLKNASKHYKSS